MNTVLLSHVECLCGMTAAIPEGGFFPLCGRCGRRMVAPIEGRVNYVSEQLPIDEAVRRHVDGEEPVIGRPIPGHTRVYDDDTLRDVLEGRGWPTDEQPWPQVSAVDGHSYPCPPWEVPS